MGKSMTTAVLSLVATLLLQSTNSIAKDDWLGSWKLDRNRSHLVGPSITIRQVTNGYLFNFGATSFTVGDDGADYPTVDSRSTSLKEISVRTWLRIHKIRGKEVDRSTIVISPDNTKMTIHTASVESGRAPRTSEDILTRVGVGDGLAGTWRSTTAGANVSNVITLKRQGTHGIRWEFPEEGQYYIVMPNGQAALNQGPRSVPGVTLIVRTLSATSMEWTESIKGNPYRNGRDTLLDGGNVLQEESWLEIKPSERQRAVYVREKP